MPELVPQPHGGAIYRGGVPGNRGGGSRPSAVRRLARKAFARRIPILEAIADSPEERARDRILAVDVLGRYGLGQAKGIDEEEFEELVLELASAVQQRLQAALPPERAEEVLRQLLGDWREILRAHRMAPSDGELPAEGEPSGEGE